MYQYLVLVHIGIAVILIPISAISLFHGRLSDFKVSPSLIPYMTLLIYGEVFTGIVLSLASGSSITPTCLKLASLIGLVLSAQLNIASGLQSPVRSVIRSYLLNFNFHN